MVAPSVGSLTGIKDPTAIGPGVPPRADRKTIEWNLWGISFVGLTIGIAAVGLALGLLIAWEPIAESAPFWSVLGFYALLARPRFFGRRHVRSLVAGFVLASLGLLAYGVLVALPSSATPADLFRAELAGSSAFVVLGCAAVYLALRGMMDHRENAIALAGLMIAAVVQVVIVMVVLTAIDAATAAASVASLEGARSLWGQVGALNMIPLAFLIAAAEILYWRLHRTYLPGVSLLEA